MEIAEAGGDMVLVREARKSYLSKKVLRSLDMTVKKGAIYGLLGPSSCGKTTLLNCILGLKALDSGSVDVKIRNSKDVGYMPQEVALLEDFTTEEICYFFGTFFGLPKNVVKQRMDRLLEFLGLEQCRKQILNTCSGGQKRRVSLVIALIHEPQLLILDEPTVGMDCLLSESIWGHLVQLSSEGKTIIITTHYIDEAKHCTMVGLMRHGKLLEEKPPSDLMVAYNSSNLEDIFLEVCKKQDDLDAEQENTDEPKNKKGKTPYTLFPDNTWFDSNRCKALFQKNLLGLWRNPVAAGGLLFLPILISIIYGSSVGTSPKNLKLGLYSPELPLGAGLRVCDRMTTKYNEGLNCTLPDVFTCTFVDALKKYDIDIVTYERYDDLVHDLERNKIWGSIEIPENFTSSLISRIDIPKETPSSVIDNSIITSRLDGTNHIIKTILSNQLKTTTEQFYNEILTSCGISEKNQIIPIKINDPVHGLKTIAFDQSALPGFILAFCFYFTLFYTSSTVMMEKVLGVTDRTSAAGMTYVEIVVAHVIIQFVVMFVQNCILFSFFYGILGYEFKGNIILAFTLTITANCVGISFGFMLTEVFRKEVTTTFTAIGVVVSIFSTGGMIWPQEGMHYLLRLFKPLIPVTSATTSMTSIIMRNFGLSHPLVAVGFIYNISWTILFSLGTFGFRKLNKFY